MPNELQYEYYKKHEYCPLCGKQRDTMELEHTFANIDDINAIDIRKCECKCGWVGIISDLVTENDFIKISKTDLKKFYQEATNPNVPFSQTSYLICQFLELDINRKISL